MTESAEQTPVITLTKAIQWFQDADETTLDSRELAEKCRDYYDHKQWTESEAATLKKRKQPIITRNRIKPKVDFLKGTEEATRTDPKAYPRNPQDDESAQAATDGIRFVCDQTKFPQIRSSVFENLTIEGVGGCEVYAKKNIKGEVDVSIRHFQWDRIFYDPHSRDKDFADALYKGGVLWMDYEEAKSQYPDAHEALATVIANEGSSTSQTFDDTPRLRWADSQRKRVRIVMMEFKTDGVWYRCEFTKSGWLSEPTESPYKDENGLPEPSLIFQSAHVDRDGNRYGWVKSWLDIQDEINKRASKHLHLVSVRQTFANMGAGGDAKKLKAELAKPDGHLEFTSGEYGKDFGVIPTMDMASAQFTLLQEAKNEIDAIGVHAALAGADPRQMSGKAIGKLQQGSTTEIKPLYTCLAQFNVNVYRAVWNRIKQFWTAEKWIRVTDDENNLKWVGLNQPVTVGDLLAEENGGQLPPEVQGDPRLSMVVKTKNAVAEMDVDIVVEDVPDMVNVMQEQFDALTQLFPAIPDPMKPAALEMLIQSSAIRNKDAFIEKLQGAMTPQGQPNPIQQQADALKLAELQSVVEKNKATAAKDMAHAQALGKPDTSNPDNELDRMHSLADLEAKHARTARDMAVAKKDTLQTATMIPQAQPQPFNGYLQ